MPDATFLKISGVKLERVIYGWTLFNHSSLSAEQ
jgi:hypothetical protein